MLSIPLVYTQNLMSHQYLTATCTIHVFWKWAYLYTCSGFPPFTDHYKEVTILRPLKKTLQYPHYWASDELHIHYDCIYTTVVCCVDIHPVPPPPHPMHRLSGKLHACYSKLHVHVYVNVQQRHVCHNAHLLH